MSKSLTDKSYEKFTCRLVYSTKVIAALIENPMLAIFVIYFSSLCFVRLNIFFIIFETNYFTAKKRNVVKYMSSICRNMFCSCMFISVIVTIQLINMARDR